MSREHVRRSLNWNSTEAENQPPASKAAWKVREPPADNLVIFPVTDIFPPKNFSSENIACRLLVLRKKCSEPIDSQFFDKYVLAEHLSKASPYIREEMSVG